MHSTARDYRMKPKSNFPYEAFAVIGQVLDDNEEKHGNHAKWRRISVNVHVSHAYQHLEQYLRTFSGHPATEDHLAHALTRLAMAICVRGKSK
jgi:hypothetical protein